MSSSGNLEKSSDKAQIAGAEETANKNVANGYMGTDANNRGSRPPKTHDHSATGDQGGQLTKTSLSDAGAASGVALLDSNSRVSSPPKTHDHSAAGDQGGTIAYSSVTGKSVVDADVASNAAIVDSKLALTTVAKSADPLGAFQAWTFDPRFGGISVAQGGTINRCYVSRNIFGQGSGATTLAFQVGNSNGNMSVAVYNNNGSNGRSASPGTTRRITTGAIACPASGYGTSAVSSTNVLFGDWLALSTDSSTSTFGGIVAPFPATVVQGLTHFQDTAHPCPSSGASMTVVLSKTLMIGAY